MLLTFLAQCLVNQQNLGDCMQGLSVIIWVKFEDQFAAVESCYFLCKLTSCKY